MERERERDERFNEVYHRSLSSHPLPINRVFGRSQKYGEHNQSRDVFGIRAGWKGSVDSSHSSETETVISVARGDHPFVILSSGVRTNRPGGRGRGRGEEREREERCEERRPSMFSAKRN